MKVKVRKRTRLSTKKMSEIMASQWPLYGSWWSMIEITPVLIVMINQLLDVSHQLLRFRLQSTYEGVKFLMILRNP